MAVGIPTESLAAIENGQQRPSGDQLLVLADFYRCDYIFFITDEEQAPISQTEKLYRRHGDSLATADRLAIQEFLYLCECESQLLQDHPFRNKPSFDIHGRYFKRHAVEAARSLRSHLGYTDVEVPRDVYSDFRDLGLHLFRRRLGNSSISGLYVRHPKAGDCILVNYDEDPYRQRFTAAHEVCHALLDGQDVVLTFHWHWSSRDLSEIRANKFASDYLMPPAFLQSISEPHTWTANKILYWAEELRVNPRALVYALKDSGLISREIAREYESLRINGRRQDPEIGATASGASRKRLTGLLERGLSAYYVRLCFDAFTAGGISSGRLAEMLLVSPTELEEVLASFGRRLPQ